MLYCVTYRCTVSRTFTASHNELKHLPGSANNWRLDYLDLSGNDFQAIPYKSLVGLSGLLPVITLKEQAARKVLQLRLPYSPATIPATVVTYLDTAKYCTCGNACFDVYLKQPYPLRFGIIAKNYSVSHGVAIVPLDCYYCSVPCYKALYPKRPISVLGR